MIDWIVWLLRLTILATGFMMSQPTIETSTPQPTALEITEAEINEEIVIALPGISNVYVDLVPGGATIKATIARQRISLNVAATATITVREGAVLLYVTQVTAGGGTVPSAIVDQINTQVIPPINAAINSLIPAQRIDSLTISNTALTVMLSANALGDNP